MDILEVLKNYIKPELLTVAVVLYFVGAGLKKSELIKDKYIPMVLGLIGVLISAIYVLATSDMINYQAVLMAVFTSLVQGILVAGLAVYVNQNVKQFKKEE